MKRNKRITAVVCAFFVVLSMSACEQVKEDEFATSQQESKILISEGADSEMTSDELLDLFINGAIDAVDAANLTSEFNIADLCMDSEEWDSYAIGERVDLDNDGENEQIICGPYGGIYLDARDNKVYELAMGEGNANMLSYTYYSGDIWLLYSNSMNAGYEAYYMVKYEGSDNLVAEIRFGEELVDANNPEAGMKYTMNGKEISCDEYTAFCSKVFAAEVSTN